MRGEGGSERQVVAADDFGPAAKILLATKKNKHTKTRHGFCLPPPPPPSSPRPSQPRLPLPCDCRVPEPPAMTRVNATVSRRGRLQAAASGGGGGADPSPPVFAP
eukprot:359927-Chlamydomonas_euryale.AAC.5